MLWRENVNYQNQKYIIVALDKEVGINTWIELTNDKKEAYRMKANYNQEETNAHLVYEVWLNQYYEAEYL